MRFRDLGLSIGLLPAGPNNAITDVAGVRVGHVTLIEGDGPLVAGRGPIRTGVSVVIPHDGDVWTEPLFAGCHRLNGNGELTGLEWVRESGLLGGAIGLTNTHSVGVVRDALVAAAVDEGRDPELSWSLPVVGETYDGLLNDMNGFHVTADHVATALATATGGPVAEGGVGGGTGMICHEFKGGIGTASRLLGPEAGGWTVGVLVQANYGRRDLLRVDGVPVGQAIPTGEVPSPYDEADRLRERAGAGRSSRSGASRTGADGGSIIVVVATDAPLLPHQCTRLAQRPALGLGRLGSIASHGSGDLFICFATGNRGLSRTAGEADPRLTVDARMVVDRAIDDLFLATIEATEEAVLNALIAAETMVGRDGITAHALPHDRLLETMASYGRGVA